MTLEEAIKHEEEIVKEEQYEYQECVATHDMEGAINCRKYAEEHRQLAEWLKDYKRLLKQEPILDQIRAEIMMKDGLEEALEIIDKYRGEVDCRECKAEYECYYCKKYEENEDKE